MVFSVKEWYAQAKKYTAYIVVLIILMAGFFYRKTLSRRQLEAAAKDNNVYKQAHTVFLNAGLHGKTKEEKRKYLLNDFTMDCTLGDAHAEISIIDHSSFSCKYCRKMRPEIRKILQEYVIDRKIAHYSLRLNYGVKNIPVGAFLQCSKPENRLEIAEKIFENGNLEKIEDIFSFLVELGKEYDMNEEYVNSCIRDGDLYRKIIYMQQNNREAFNVNATPILLINNQEKVGYQTHGQIRDTIENILKERQK
ncbi:MAG: DsbA family protein [Rickettsiales bacterium]|jgi:protein-disulfide isomerase|nr:DsbA family protein [Rickettsiales bacterium]